MRRPSVIGYALSLLLTAAAFLLVMRHALPVAALAAAVAVLAVLIGASVWIMYHLNANMMVSP